MIWFIERLNRVTFRQPPTRLAAATMIALRLIENGLLCLTDTVGRFFTAPTDKTDITIRQLMTHTSGIAAHFHLTDWTDDPAKAVDVILGQPLVAGPGETTIYSCMGFILLGKILEQVGGQPLDGLARDWVFDPLGMTRTTYRPEGDIAPTEWDPGNERLICGTVHDENARFLSGISANAGVFSDLDDMIRFAAMLASGGRRADGSAFLSPGMYRLATADHAPDKSEHRGLGFQLTGEGSFMGDLFPAGSFGHTGFTGTSLAVDPVSGLYVILLTNRVNPTRDNLAIIRFRKVFHNAIFAAFSRNDQSCG
jgi:CubicO group peptidase (beta-lactamase class C family)